MLLPVHVVVGTASVYSVMLVLSGTLVVDVLVVQSYRFSRAGVEETLVLPQLRLVENFGRRHPCLYAEAIPMVLFSENH